MALPRVWASDTNYSSGVDSGTPTKVDPGAGLTAQGFIPGSGVPAQHMNYILHQLTARAAADFRRALYLHRLVLDGETIDDTSAGIAALSQNEHLQTVVAKANTNGVILAGDAEHFELGGTLADITGDVRGGVRSGGTYLVVGDGTNHCARSTDGGSTWSAGGDAGASLVDVALTDVEGLVHVNALRSSGVTVYSTDMGVSWDTPEPGDNIVAAGLTTQTALATLSGGIVVCCGLDSGGDVAFARSADGGQSFVAGSGTVVEAATMSDSGWVTGNNGTEIYHAGRRNVQFVDISVSTDGNTWTTRSTVQSLGTVTGVRIRLCPNTGLLVLFAALNSGVVEIRASLDSGYTWSPPSYAPGFTLTGFAVAAGRIYATKGAAVYSTARIL